MKQTNGGAALQQILERFAHSPAYQHGNAVEFSPATIEFNPTSPLVGKQIGFLGSSVTYGLPPGANLLLIF